MSKVSIVGTERGGDGKTTLTLLLAELRRARGHLPVVVDADDKASADTRLAQLLPYHEIRWLGAGPDADAIQEDPDALARHWDALAEIARENDVIVDLGANTAQRLLQYLETARRGWKRRGIEVEWLVPFMADADSFAKALKTLESASAVLGADATLVAVRNERGGRFGGWDGSAEMQRLHDLERNGVYLHTIPNCRAPENAWLALKRAELNPVMLTGLDDDDIVDLAGKLELDDLVVERMYNAVVKWVDACTTALDPYLPAIEKPKGKSKGQAEKQTQATHDGE